MVGLLLAAAWSSQGVNFTDLNMADYNVHAAFEFYIVVAVMGNSGNGDGDRSGAGAVNVSGASFTLL